MFIKAWQFSQFISLDTDIRLFGLLHLDIDLDTYSIKEPD